MILQPRDRISRQSRHILCTPLEIAPCHLDGPRVPSRRKVSVRIGSAVPNPLATSVTAPTIILENTGWERLWFLSALLRTLLVMLEKRHHLLVVLCLNVGGATTRVLRDMAVVADDAAIMTRGCVGGGCETGVRTGSRTTRSRLATHSPGVGRAVLVRHDAHGLRE